MAALARRRQRATNIWPGFVDALATMLMVIMFLLMVFVLAQFFLGQALSGRDQALSRLQNQINELAGLLSLEKRSNKDLRKNFAQLSEELQISVALRDDLKTTIGHIRQRAEAAERDLTAAQAALKVDK
ncbi:MAG: chemotaxis protein, partial [Rhodospirillales bacterium]